jgi:hypothetical protein
MENVPRPGFTIMIAHVGYVMGCVKADFPPKTSISPAYCHFDNPSFSSVAGSICKPDTAEL